MGAGMSNVATRYADSTIDALVVGGGDDGLQRRLSWGAVSAGLAVTIVLQITINLLGAGLGIALFEPLRPGISPDASTFGLGGGVWWIAANWIAVTVGTFVAGRLAPRLHDRDGVSHGLVVWASSLIFTFVVLAAVVGGVAAGAISTRDQAVSVLTATPNSPEGVRALTNQLVADPASVDRPKLVQALAHQAGISDQEADARLARFEQDTRSAADATKRAVSSAAIWSCLALLVGAIAAFLGGREGARAGRSAKTEPAPVSNYRT